MANDDSIKRIDKEIKEMESMRNVGDKKKLWRIKKLLGMYLRETEMKQPKNVDILMEDIVSTKVDGNLSILKNCVRSILAK